MRRETPATPDLQFASLDAALRRSVARTVRASPDLIDDACQTAWLELLPRSGGVQCEAALAWLQTTAQREAIRSVRRCERELPLLEADLETALSRDPAELVAQRSRLAEVSALPVRQQRLLWLKSLGFSYEEIADTTGDSHRTIERQLSRARERLRAA